MTITNNEVIKRFQEGRPGNSNSLRSAGGILYSYAMPLLVKMPWGILMNADRVSVTTSIHQAIVQRLAEVRIPFSALNAAGIAVEGFLLLDRNSPKEITHRVARLKDEFYGSVGRSRRRISMLRYNASPPHVRAKYNILDEIELRPEHAVLSYEGRFFLSGMDGGSFFLSELPREVSSVIEAEEILKPEGFEGMKEGVDYHRQGEWFFTPYGGGKEARVIYKSLLTPRFVLPRHNGGNAHTATRGLAYLNMLLVSGSISHPQHPTLQLSLASSPVIYRAFRNRATGSWSASGRVD